MTKSAVSCSLDDRRWRALGVRSKDGGFYLEIQRPGIPSVLREIRRRDARRGRGMRKPMQFSPSFARGNQTALSIALSWESVLNLKRVLDQLFEQE